MIVISYFVHRPWFIINILTVALYWEDKKVSKTKSRSRIPENILLLLGLVGGWPAAICAQQAFRHKTVKLSFKFKFIGTILANLILLVMVKK